MRILSWVGLGAVLAVGFALGCHLVVETCTLLDNHDDETLFV